MQIINFKSSCFRVRRSNYQKKEKAWFQTSMSFMRKKVYEKNWFVSTHGVSSSSECSRLCSFTRQKWGKLHQCTIVKIDSRTVRFQIMTIYPQSQVRVFIYITWYKTGPAWTHALESPHWNILLFKREFSLQNLE